MTAKKRSFRSFSLCLLLSLVMILIMGHMTVSFAAPDDPNLGFYRTDGMMGLSVDQLVNLMGDGSTAEDIRNMFTLELRDGGIGLFTSDGETVSLFWKTDGTGIVLSETLNPNPNEDVMKGTIENGVIKLDIEGIELVLKKEGTAGAEKSPEAPPAVPAADSDDITGVYRMYSYSGIDMQTYASLTGLTPEQSANLWVIDVRPDGIAYMSLNSMPSQIRWARNGSAIALIADPYGEDDTINGTISGDTFKMNLDGTEVVLKRDPK